MQTANRPAMPSLPPKVPFPSLVKFLFGLLLWLDRASAWFGLCWCPWSSLRAPLFALACAATWHEMSLEEKVEFMLTGGAFLLGAWATKGR